MQKFEGDTDMEFMMMEDIKTNHPVELEEMKNIVSDMKMHLSCK